MVVHFGAGAIYSVRAWIVLEDKQCEHTILLTILTHLIPTLWLILRLVLNNILIIF